MNILIIRNNFNQEAMDTSYLVGAYFASQGVTCAYEDSSSSVEQIREAAEQLGGVAEIDMVIALGGDGTILKAASAVAEHSTPILGLNYGHLGFLVNSVKPEGVFGAIMAALAGDVIRDERANLDISFYRGEELVMRKFALNEVTLARGENGRIIEFDVLVDGCRFVHLRGDGLVISSATGSTAYALSAGGPIVSPTHKGLVVVPLAAHTLAARAAVTGPSDVVEVDLVDNQDDREATYFVDGESLDLRSEGVDRVVIKRSEHPTVLLRYKDQGFFSRVNATFFN